MESHTRLDRFFRWSVYVSIVVLVLALALFLAAPSPKVNEVDTTWIG